MMTRKEKEALFNAQWDQFLNELSTEQVEHYFALNQTLEISYMKNFTNRFKETFLSIHNSEKPLNILEIGTSPFIFFLKKVYPYHSLTTIDLTNFMEGRCTTRNIHFQQCDITKERLPFEDNYFDVVLFCEVLEHLFINPNKIFSEIRRVLRNNGILVFSTPNIASLVKRFRLLRGKSPLADVKSQLRQGHPLGYGHIREYTMDESITILDYCGFSAIKRKFFSPPFSTQKVLSLKWQKQIINRFMCLVMPSLRQTIFIIALSNK